MILLVAIAIGFIAETWRSILIACGIATAILAAIKLPTMFRVAAELGIRDPNPIAVIAQTLFLVTAIASATFATRRFMKKPEELRRHPDASWRIFLVVLRETSTVFAALIGWLVLGEKSGRMQVALMGVIAAGAVLVEWGGR